MAPEHSSYEALFAAHRYLCRRGAKKFLRRGLEHIDLEQVAAIGLVKACRRYDATMQTPFEAFAWIMIVGELMHYVRDVEHAVRVPRWVRSVERRYADVAERLAQEFNREPSDAEVATVLGVAVRIVAEVRRAVATRVYERVDVERCGAGASSDPLDGVLAKRALAAVEPRARAIMLGIYAAGLSRNEIARRSGMTPRQVTRAHNAALSRMRLALRAS